MATNAKVGTGTKLQYSSSSTAVSGYAAFAELLDINSPQSEYAMIDATSHDTTGAKEYIAATLADGGTLDVTFNYVSATATKLAGMIRAKRAFRIKYPNSACHRFQGILKGWHITSPVSDKMTAVASIQVCSYPAFSATSTVS